MLDAITAPLAIEEDVNAAAQDLSVSGSLTVTDVDLSDTLTANAGVAVVKLDGLDFTLSESAQNLLSGLTFETGETSDSGVLQPSTGPIIRTSPISTSSGGPEPHHHLPVTVTDGTGTSNTQNLVITITGTNDGPVAVADTNGTDTVLEAGDQPAVTGDASASATC